MSKTPKTGFLMSRPISCELTVGSLFDILEDETHFKKQQIFGLMFKNANSIGPCLLKNK